MRVRWSTLRRDFQVSDDLLNCLNPRFDAIIREGGDGSFQLVDPIRPGVDVLSDFYACLKIADRTFVLGVSIQWFMSPPIIAMEFQAA